MSYSIIATLHKSERSRHMDRLLFMDDQGLYKTGLRGMPPKSFYGRVGTYCKPSDMDEFFKYTTGARMKACLSRWSGIVDRSHHGYAILCDEWKNYINFAKWFEKESERFTIEQLTRTDMYAPGRLMRLDIDKDLFQQTDYKCYCPQNCCILPWGINTIIKVGKRKIFRDHDLFRINLHNEFLFAESKEELLSLYESKGMQEIEHFISLYGNLLTPRIIERLKYYFSHGEEFLVED